MNAHITMTDTCRHGTYVSDWNMDADEPDHLYQRFKAAGKNVTRTATTITVVSERDACAHGERDCPGTRVETITYQPQDRLL